MMTTTREVVRVRLARQMIDPPGGGSATPAEVVRRLGAVQAQEYNAALWAIGSRCEPEVTVADVESAIERREIVRTWPMRGTLHFVAPEDVRWMLALLAPRRLAKATKRHSDLGLDARTFDRAAQLLSRELAGGAMLTRSDTMALLEADGIGTEGQRGYHVLWTLAQQGLMCMGPMRGRQQTFVLLDDWIGPPAGPMPTGDAALALLAERFFGGHGPATVDDLAWWAGITKSAFRDAAGRLRERLITITADGTEYLVSADGVGDAAGSGGVHLLPSFDEYMLGYTDRTAMMAHHHVTYRSTIAANGMLSPILVVDGVVRGVWRRRLTRDAVAVTVSAFEPLSASCARPLERATARYARFLGREPSLAVATV